MQYLSRSHPRFYRGPGRRRSVSKAASASVARADHSERTLEQDPVLGWKSKTLGDQVALPIVTPVEMGQPSLDVHHSWDRGIEEYRKSFQQVFGRKPNCPDLVRAIASYERMQVAFDAPFDLFIAGDNNTIDDSAKRGWELFNTKGSLQ